MPRRTKLLARCAAVAILAAAASRAHADDTTAPRYKLTLGRYHDAQTGGATDLNLRLDDDWVARALGRNDRFVDGERDIARADGYIEAGEVLLALVFEQVHAVSFSASIVW